MHNTHRAGGTDERAFIVRTQVAVSGDPCIAFARVRADGATEADKVVVNTTDVKADLAGDGFSAEDNTHDRTGTEQQRRLFNAVRVRSEEDDVIEGLSFKTINTGNVNGNDLRRLVISGQLFDRAFADNQQATTVCNVVALCPRVGAFNGCPRLDQANGRCRRTLGHVDQELFTFGGDDTTLIDDRVFLKGTVEVVTECAIGLRSAQMLPVSLDQQTIANLEVGDLLAYLDDADNGLVTRNRRLGAGTVVRDLGKCFGGDSRDDFGLTRVLVELVQQLRVREADATCLNLEHHLVRADLVDALLLVDDEFFGADDLDRILRFGVLSHWILLVFRIKLALSSS